jgi:hypothetical protein
LQPGALRVWRRDEPPVWEPRARQVSRPDGIHAPPARVCWRHEIQVQAWWRHETQAPACWRHETPDVARCGARGATRSALPEQDGFPRESQASSPEPFSPEQDEIQVWAQGAFQDARPGSGFQGEPLERGFQGGPPEHVPRGGLQGCAFQAVPLGRALQDALRVATQDEQQEHEPQVALPVRAIQELDGIQDEFRVHALRGVLPVALQAEMPGRATQVVLQAFAIRGALRVCEPQVELPVRAIPELDGAQNEPPAHWLRGVLLDELQAGLPGRATQVVPLAFAIPGAPLVCELQVELPKRCAPGPAVSPRPACADDRRSLLRKQCGRREPAPHAGSGWR